MSLEPLALSYFAPLPNQSEEHSNNTRATPFVASWPEFAARLGNPKPGAHKRANGAWSPARYLDNYKKNENVAQISLLVFDVDGKGLPFDRCVDLLLGRSVILHTSFSHGVKGDSYRVIFKVSRPILPREFADVWRFGESLVPGVDQACKDPGRLWWLPVGREGSRCVVNFGSCIDVDLALEVSALRKVVAANDAPKVIASHGQAGPATNCFDSSLLSHAERGAIAWLATRDPAIDRDHGGGGPLGTKHGWVTFVKLTRGFDLGPNLTPAVMSALHAWNARCKRPWTDAELTRELCSADAKGKMERGQMLREYTPKPRAA